MATDVKMVKRVYQGKDFDKLVRDVKRDIYSTKDEKKKARLKKFLREITA